MNVLFFYHQIVYLNGFLTHLSTNVWGLAARLDGHWHELIEKTCNAAFQVTRLGPHLPKNQTYVFLGYIVYSPLVASCALLELTASQQHESELSLIYLNKSLAFLACQATLSVLDIALGIMSTHTLQSRAWSCRSLEAGAQACAQSAGLDLEAMKSMSPEVLETTVKEQLVLA